MAPAVLRFSIITTALTVLMLPLVLPGSAGACSLVPGAQTASIRGVVGATPLLMADSADAELRNERGQQIPLDRVEPAELSGALGTGGRPIFFFRPRAALADGQYNFQQGRYSFEVQAAAEAPIPELGTNGGLQLYIDNNPGDDGAGGPFSCGGSISSCGDVTALNIMVPVASADPRNGPNILVTLTTPEGLSFQRLVSDEFGFVEQPELRFYGSFAETGHLRQTALCVTVAGVSSAGEVGPAQDLGCIDPDDRADPRVTNEGGGGCSAHGSRRSVPVLPMLLMAMAVMRRRARAG